MLEYNEVKPGKYILYNGEPYEVLGSHVARTQMRKPQNQVKIRNLINGRVIPATFHASDNVEEAHIDTRPIKFVYENRGKYCFSEIKDPSKRFFLDAAVIGPRVKYLKENTEVTALTFTPEDSEEAKIIGIKMPVKMELLVKEAPPAVRGNTVQGGTKQVTLETGATINVPLFVNEGDIIRINTETGEYVERVDKR
jgi:elongation factor P